MSNNIILIKLIEDMSNRLTEIECKLHNSNIFKESNEESKQNFFIQKTNFIPKSFRFTDIDMEVLELITNKLNAITNIKITQTKTLQLLIHYCKNIDAEGLITAFGDMI